jgi:GNAT superfamily N-acetyltransferase
VTVDGVAMYVLDGEATLVTCEIDMPDSRQLVRGAVDAARRCEASSLQITISPDYLGAGPAIEELRRRGAIRGTDDILAADLAASAPHIRDRPRVEVIEVSTFEQVVEFERTSACGWGYPHPSAEAIQGAYSRLTPGWFLGSLDGEAAGTAGFALVGVVARLWGGAVVPAMRGRGVYRNLVTRRMAAASARGATLALVHAAPTSSPILQHLGFRKFGERHTFRLPLAAE